MKERTLYQETLQSGIEGYRVSEEGRDNADDASESLVYQNYPISLRSKGLSLLYGLKLNQDISWNAKGEIIVDNKILDGSNIIDLIGD